MAAAMSSDESPWGVGLKAELLGETAPLAILLLLAALPFIAPWPLVPLALAPVVVWFILVAALERR